MLNLLRSHYAEHEGKERFERAPTRERNQKLLHVSPQNLIRNRQAIKDELNRRLEWQMWLLTNEREETDTEEPRSSIKSSKVFIRVF